MIETTFAQRFVENATSPWGITVQMKRTALSWSAKDGVKMAGTWSGRIPQNGIYRFLNHTNACDEDGISWLSDFQPIMICTFNADGSWEGVDFNYKNEFRGQTLPNDSFVTTLDPSELIADTFSHAGSNQIGSTDLLRLRTDNLTLPKAINQREILKLGGDYLGFVACWRNIFFTARDAISGAQSSILGGIIPKTIHPHSVSGKSIQTAGAMEFQTMGFTVYEDSSATSGFKYDLKMRVNGSLISKSGQTYPNISTGGGIKTSTLTGTSGTTTLTDLEGTWGDDVGSVYTRKPTFSKIILNEAVSPFSGFVYGVGSAQYSGDAFVVGEVDFFNNTTTLIGINFSPSQN